MKTVLIAEIGENHLGNWDLCRALVRQAAANGATVAKFQTYTADQFGADHPWHAEFRRVEMPVNVHFEMQALCRELGLGFLSSTFTVRSTAFLVDRMGVDAVKLASSRVTDDKLLDYVDRRADQVRTVYLSTGMSTLDEVRAAVDRLSHVERLCLLQCTSQYPTPDEAVQLLGMTVLAETFPHCGVGFSDHSRGLEACTAAVALGAQVLEKHFTFHPHMPGDDHAGALTPESLAELVRRISRLEVMLGTRHKAPLASEALARRMLRVPMQEVGFEA